MKKRILALLTSLALGTSLLAGCGATATQPTAGESTPAATSEAADAASGAGTAETAETAPDPADTLIILHTNDIHGHVVADLEAETPNTGLAQITAAKKAYENAGYKVLLFSAGDDTQGMPIVNMSQGQQAIDFMNAAGYDAACPGNHEFDWGEDNALAVLGSAEYPVLAANITRKSDGTLLFGDHTVFDMGEGFKVGVFGLDTPMTSTSTNPDNVANVAFAAADELYAVAQAQVDALEAENCDVIVALGHLGVDESAAPNRSYDVIDNVQGIDIFIDGHSHTELTEQRGDTLLQSTGCYNHNLGEIAWNAAGKTAVGKLIPAAELTDADPEMDELVSGVNDKIQAELSKSFAKTEVALNGERAPGVRTEETNLGDLTADAILWKAGQATGQTIDAAIENGGGIRESIAAGDITMNDIKTVFPFGNTISVLQVKGSELLEALEGATSALPDDAIGGFPQVAGLQFTVDTTVPFEAGELYPDTTINAPANPGARVSITDVGGKGFDPEAIYTIATNEFVAAGGDTYYVFRYANATARVESGVALEDAMIDYITDELGGVIGQDYAQPKGRIVIQ